jgi:uncharacterized protein (DUF736 family)
MATVGTFTKNETGFAGALKTLSLDIKVTLVPVHLEGDKTPHYRVLAGNVEFGAAWKKTSLNGRAYLAVRLDDPSFSGPISANMIEGEDDHHSLI